MVTIIDCDNYLLENVIKSGLEISKKRATCNVMADIPRKMKRREMSWTVRPAAEGDAILWCGDWKWNWRENRLSLVCLAITSYRLAVKQDNKVNNGHANERLKRKLEGTTFHQTQGNETITLVYMHRHSISLFHTTSIGIDNISE